MRKLLTSLFAAALVLMSCNEISPELKNRRDESVEHGLIVLGNQLENPYTTTNVRKAFKKLYPTKAAETVSTTNLYVRFLPSNQDEFDILEEMGLELLDHPMDYAIVREGDYYHDPAVGDDNITWQYAVVPVDFSFPGITYEIIDECFIAENVPSSRAADDVDWDEVERLSYELTGNGEIYPMTRAGGATCPSGRITIVDEHANGGQPFGLAGVKVSCNTFVKFSSTYTDRDGYYQMPRSFSATLRYRLIFTNQAGFSIGFNMVLVPASVSTLGKGPATGLDYTITKNSDGALFRRSVVNNAAYDYISRCGKDDMNIPAPPTDLRIWIFKGLSASSAVMIHHGAIVDALDFNKYLDIFAGIVKYFAPDITIGTKGSESYSEIYDTVCHELAHASHFQTVGTSYWNKYSLFIVSSFLTSGGKTYGTGAETNAGYCEVGEMWAYYLSSMMHSDRYGGTPPNYGYGYWFHPQIFRLLEERGLSRCQLYAALNPESTTKAALKQKLISLYPTKQSAIEQVFNRYK